MLKVLLLLHQDLLLNSE